MGYFAASLDDNLHRRDVLLQLPWPDPTFPYDPDGDLTSLYDSRPSDHAAGRPSWKMFRWFLRFL